MTDERQLLELPAGEIARRVNAGELRAEAVAVAHLSRIRAADPGIRAFLQVLEEDALAAARAVDRRVAAGGTAGRLAGVPVAVKDNMLVRGAAATCGSKFLKNYRAVYDATVVRRIKEEGAVIVGKTNMDEFAMGSSTENSAFPPTRNPWDPERVPGGSSGGSAAAVAARMVPLALGSDTGGSIRQPASFCGTVGLKPSYGTVSRYGLVAYASSLDQIGPLARTVEDAALALSVIAGHDPADSTSAARAPEDFTAASAGGIGGLRVGLPREYFAAGLDPEVEQAVRGAAQACRELGAEVVEVSLPHTRCALSAYYIIAPAEASSNLARFDGVRYGVRDAGGAGGIDELYRTSRGAGFGAEVKLRIMLGTYALSSGYYAAFYMKAQQVRTLVKRDFAAAFARADILLTPTAPTPAFRFGEKADPLQMYLGDIYTAPCNVAGHCGVSLPCGRSAAGLPIGVQLMGRPAEDGVLLRAARALEAALPRLPAPAAAISGGGSSGGG
ncbi:MAG: Asp-tRNA(Asn)/Glu-tRNA(Gln) amidotransferase subunit GatA [Elusimicrobiota bacterium]